LIAKSASATTARATRCFSIAMDELAKPLPPTGALAANILDGKKLLFRPKKSPQDLLSTAGYQNGETSGEHSLVHIVN